MFGYCDTHNVPTPLKIILEKCRWGAFCFLKWSLVAQRNESTDFYIVLKKTVAGVSELIPWLCTFRTSLATCAWRHCFHFRENKLETEINLVFTSVRSPTSPPLYLGLLDFLHQNSLLVLVVSCAQTSLTGASSVSLSWCPVICKVESAARVAVKLEEL